MWTFDSDDGTPGSRDYRGQGNHGIAVGNVDADGRDEIIYGSCVIDDNSNGLYSTSLGHGDEMHFSHIHPARPGLEIFKANGDGPSAAGQRKLRADTATDTLLLSLKWIIIDVIVAASNGSAKPCGDATLEVSDSGGKLRITAGG